MGKKMMKILIGTLIHISKDYAMERWLENVSKLQQKYPADFLMVDNSPGTGYVEKLKSYCKKYGIKKYKIKHIEVSQGMIGDEVQERIAKAQEIIRQEVLSKDYDAWWSWESDIILPTNSLGKLIGMIRGGIMVVVHNSWMRRHPGHPDFDMGCTLISREALKKCAFLPEPGSSYWQGEDDLYKLRVLEGGGSFAEVVGLIEPIYHLAE